MTEAKFLSSLLLHVSKLLPSKFGWWAEGGVEFHYISSVKTVFKGKPIGVEVGSIFDGRNTRWGLQIEYKGKKIEWKKTELAKFKGLLKKIQDKARGQHERECELKNKKESQEIEAEWKRYENSQKQAKRNLLKEL